MTDRETINYIKEAVKTYMLFNSLTRSDRADVEEMLDNLEKQVAKKVVNEQYCPNCGEYIEFLGYCPVCGQKLEW